MPWATDTKFRFFDVFCQPLNSSEFGAELDRVMAEVETNTGQAAIDLVEALIVDYLALKDVFKANSLGQGVGLATKTPRGPLAEVGEAIKFHRPSDGSDLEWRYAYAKRQERDWLDKIRQLMGLDAYLDKLNCCCHTINFV